MKFLFNGKEGKDPYRYTIIDHSKKIIFKGLDSTLTANEYNCFVRLWYLPIVDKQRENEDRKLETESNPLVRQNTTGN